MVNFYDKTSFIISLPIQLISRLNLCILVYDLSLFVIFAISAGIWILFILRNVNNRLSSIVKNEKTVNRFLCHRELRQFMSDHNEICRLFFIYNRFWSKPYFTLILTMIPVSLISLHTIFFEEIDEHVEFFMTLITILLVMSLFMLQYLYAYITKKVHKNTKLFAKLQWKLKGWPFRLATKLKLMAYFERLSANKKIGLTLGPTVTLTFPVFSQVLIFS